MGNTISIPGLDAPITKSSRLRALLAQCHDDPDRFAATILGAKPFDSSSSSPFWYRQSQAAQMLVQNRILVCPWGHSLGKSWFTARLCLWWLATRHNSLIVTTAPSHHQLSSVLWKNIRAAVSESKYPLGGHLTQSPLGLRFGPEWACHGISTNKTERMAGQHNGQLLVVADEASGIDPVIYAAIDSLAARKILLIGNPIRADGYFKERYDESLIQARENTLPPEERTVSLRVPSTDSPDIDLPYSKRGLAAGVWLRDIYRKYSEDSLYVRSRIRAQFPEQSSDTLIPERWLDIASTVNDAANRKLYPHGVRRIGADLGTGRGKDKSVIVVRDDLGILEVIHSNTTDFAGIAYHYANLVKKYDISPTYQTYDANGIGESFPAHLARHRITARAYYGGTPLSTRYTNHRTACAFALRRRLDPNYCPSGKSIQPTFCIPPRDYWSFLREEIKTLSYDQVADKSRLISKEDHKAILGRSPDYLDALLQTFFIS